MPAFSVTLNGEFLVSVATDDFDVVDVGISGDVLGPEHATLRVSAGAFPEGGKSLYLIWENERVLAPGDRVSVAFDTDGRTSRPGKTIDELYPDEPSEVRETTPSIEQIVTELKTRPRVFPCLAFEFTGTDGMRVCGRTLPDQHALSFGAVWNSRRPDRARVAVRTYAFESLLTKDNGTYHAESVLAQGARVGFVLMPESSGAEA